MVANLGHDSSKEHLGEGGGQMYLEQLEARGPTHTSQRCCRMQVVTL